MSDPTTSTLLHGGLAGLAGLAWLLALLVAVPRYRAFRQRADLWWALAFALMLVAAGARALEAWGWRSAAAAPGAASLTFAVAFEVASVLALVAYRSRSRPID